MTHNRRQESDSSELSWYYDTSKFCDCVFCWDCNSPAEWLLKIGECMLAEHKKSPEDIVVVNFEGHVRKNHDKIVKLALDLANAPVLVRFRAVAEGWSISMTSRELN